MRNKKESQIVRIEEEVMKDVLRKIKGSKLSRAKFVSEAVSKEIKRLDEELNSSVIKAMSDEYYDNEDSYKKRGIKSFDEFATKMATTPDKITKLEKKLDGFLKIQAQDQDMEDTADKIRKTNPKLGVKLDALMDKEMDILRKQYEILFGKIKRSRKSK